MGHILTLPYLISLGTITKGKGADVHSGAVKYQRSGISVSNTYKDRRFR